MASTHRTVVHSGRFTEESEALAKGVPRWGRMISGVEWALCKNPGVAGQPTNDPRVWALPTIAWPDAPAVTIFYEFEENTVTLLSVVRSDPSL
jgi:hypothetical protein